MASRRRAFVLFAMVAIAVAVEAAWLAPATLLDPYAARASGGVLRVADAEGTVWHGRGNVVAGTARIPVAWRVGFWPLLQGVLRVDVTSGTRAETPRATITISADTLSFADVDVTVPARILSAALGQAAVAAVDGDIHATAANFAWKPHASRGEARIAWRAARMAFVGTGAPLALGEVRTTLTADGDLLSGSVTNDGGDLALRGEWSIRTQDQLRVALHVTPRHAGHDELARVLATIGTADGAGWRIDWHAPLQ